MKILILGAGWYGCHCATTLLNMNIKFKIADLTNDFFNGSSSKNQNRLHLAFHYCRSFYTRKECQIGYQKFMEKYGEFIQTIPNNYYCIDNKSILDFETYKSIYNFEKNNFFECEIMDLDFLYNKDLLEGILKVDEKFIDFRKAKNYFKNLLQSYLISNYDSSKLKNMTYDNETFDYIIDCTYSKINKNMFYENCISLLYEYIGPKNDFAITIMDGPFWSLYPYDMDNKLYTLTDVEYTPLGIIENKNLMENKITKYIPDFKNHFHYKGYFISQKAKCLNNTDNRSLVWKKEENRFYFSGGKITGIFAMEDILKSYLT